MNRIYPYSYQEETPTPNKPSEIITFWVDEVGNKYIQKLEKENKQLKDKYERFKNNTKIIEEFANRYEKIMEELEEWLNECLEKGDKHKFIVIRVKDVLNKIQELKEKYK